MNGMMSRSGLGLLSPLVVLLLVQLPEARAAAGYWPTAGGWEIRIRDEQAVSVLDREDSLGAVEGNPRLHRRPLYPPADRALIWSPEELLKLERCGFRPLVLARNEPRFLFDFHSAGGLLGHLHLGLTTASASKWFHQWSRLDVRYLDGRMWYTLRDPAFPHVVVQLVALPLADAAGLVVGVVVEGSREPATLVWAYGGASAFFTNYAMDAPAFAFAPEHCAKDRVEWNDGQFTLRRSFDKTDAYLQEIFAAARYLTNWQAVVRGGSSWPGRNGYGLPSAFTNSPAELVKTADWRSAADAGGREGYVAVQEVPLETPEASGFVVVGMGRRMNESLRGPEAAWRAALARNEGIASRVVARTPDPWLDAAMEMMAFATEGTWGDSAILHGGWSWRFAYLGWRGWYGSDCYGWTDRVRTSIENHAHLSVVREGPDAGGLGSLLEYPPGIYYNMNEVFLDQVRHYFDYTNDLDLMRRIYPVLVGILDRENRRLQPGGAALYENSLNTWISDSHWYIQGQCAQASAYMLGAHRFVADLARRLGQDPAPFLAQAERIRAAMQEKLWRQRAGVFAEYRDTRGERLLHTEPELPTLYHTAEFGAAHPAQIYQMLHWADTHLRSELTPGGGKLVWSSNWHPNRGRSYTHSTYELAYAEELNFALTHYLVGRNDEAYALLRGVLNGLYSGPTPGGLPCHADVTGRQRANDEFADAISMWGRAVIEGLFGILPKRPEGLIELSPQFPSDWNEAAVDTPHFSYHWSRRDGRVRMEWQSPAETGLRLRLPIQATRVSSVRVGGLPARFTLEPGFAGTVWVHARVPSGRNGTIEVRYTPRKLEVPAETTVKPGDRVEVALGRARVDGWNDPQGLLSQANLTRGALRGLVTGSAGPGLLFLRSGPSWIPVRLRIQPTNAAASRIWSPPPTEARDLSRWTLVDLSTVFNASVTNVLPRVSEAAQPPPAPASQVGFSYWKDHLLQYHGSRNQEISDAAWRAKVGPDNVAWTTDGIPFKTARVGPNIGVVTRAGGFPWRLEFPVAAAGRTLYLMVSGMTFPVQSHVVNLRLVLHYADGPAERRDLVNPFDIGDGWSTWCGRLHDTAANGFENLGGRAGPAGSALVTDLTQPIALDTEAHLLAIDLRPGVVLRRVEIEAAANDVIYGLMGATIRP